MRPRRLATATVVRCVLVAVSVAGCGARPEPTPGADPRARTAAVEWGRAGTEAAELLSGYLKIDTMGPDAHEHRGARYLAAALEQEGIASELIELSPGRSSLIARLPSTREEPPLCLLSHIDVVAADPAEWPADTGPLSGAIDVAGMIWGRGALDMKGMGTLELLTLVWLKRLGLPLRRDVVLIAVADEEQGNRGMKDLVEHHWDKLGCAHVINEGGIGIRGLFFDEQTVLPISVAEKSVLWLRLTVRGAGGHGSTPRAEHTPHRLIELLAQLDQRQPKLRLHHAIEALLARAGRAHGGVEGYLLQRPRLVRSFLKGRLLANPLTRAAVTDTVAVTGISAGSAAPNVIEAVASAVLDCRLLPDTQPAQLIAEIEELLGHDPSSQLEVISQEPSLESPWEDDPVYAALERQARIEWPGIVTGPALSVGFTDSLYARRKGARAYGFVPFVVSAEEAATMHGRGERVSVDNMRRGLRTLLQAVVAVAAR